MKRLLAVLATGMLAFSSAHAWDTPGHMLVCQIAWEKSSPAVRQKVAELVPLLPSDFNNGQPYNFITAGAWMDDWRSHKGYPWSKWHYVNIEWTPDASGFALPEGPHIVTALHWADARLRQKEPALTSAEQAEALGMIFHLVGDIHQPLHCCERKGDKGGNAYLIYGIPFTDLWPGTVANLHTFWDKAYHFDARDGQIVQTWLAPDVAGRPPTGESGLIKEQAAKLLEKWPESVFTKEEIGGTFEDWAKEDYTLACKVAYPPGEAPGPTEVKTIDPGFCHQANEVATRRIVQAGLRLAKAIEALLGNP